MGDAALSVLALLFNFFGGLPKEKIRARWLCRKFRRGRTMDDLVHSMCGMNVARSTADQSGCARNAWWMIVCEQHQHVNHFEDAGHRAVRGQEQESDNGAGEQGRPEIGSHSSNHLHRIGHASQVGSDVECIRDQQQGTGGPQDPTRIACSNHSGQTLSGDHSKPCAHQLHGRHERKREERGPESGVAEGGPRNRISGYAGRVVVEKRQ